jgi:hypothetical protein
VGRTVRPLLADRPPGRRGPSARLVGKRGGTGRSGANNGPSALGCQTVRACHAQVGPRSRGDKSAASFLFPKTQEAFPSLSFLFCIKEKAPSLGILIRALLRPSEHIPGLSARFSTMSPRYFFKYLILSLGFGARR